VAPQLPLLTQLRTPDCRWEACSPSVHEDMMSDWPHRFDTNLGEMMAAGVRVLIYAGTEDFICNV
jgi:hypothetical protein